MPSSESSLNMILHSFVVGVVVYIFLVYGMGKQMLQSIDISILFGALSLIYMVVFGHNLPSAATINPNLNMK